jgi:hypothetical protein
MVQSLPAGSLAAGDALVILSPNLAAAEVCAQEQKNPEKGQSSLPTQVALLLVALEYLGLYAIRLLAAPWKE